jgi:hypothetical protein
VQQMHSQLLNANALGSCMHHTILSHSVPPSLPILPNSHETTQRKAHACSGRHSRMQLANCALQYSTTAGALHSTELRQHIYTHARPTHTRSFCHKQVLGQKCCPTSNVTGRASRKMTGCQARLSTTVAPWTLAPYRHDST